MNRVLWRLRQVIGLITESILSADDESREADTPGNTDSGDTPEAIRGTSRLDSTTSSPVTDISTPLSRHINPGDLYGSSN